MRLRTSINYRRYYYGSPVAFSICRKEYGNSLSTFLADYAILDSEDISFYSYYNDKVVTIPSVSINKLSTLCLL